MADTGQRPAAAMAFWGTIQAAVAERASTAQIWEAITERSAQLGLPIPPGMFQQVNEIRSTAAQLRNGSEALSAAPASNRIEGSYLAHLPYGAPEGQRAGPRIFDVRVAYTAVRGGNPETGFVTLRYTGGLPATVGELRSEAEDIAASLVEGYGASFTGTGAIEIGEL